MIVITGPIRRRVVAVRLASGDARARPPRPRRRLRDAERDRGVDVDAAVRRLLHDPDAGRGGRELDDDVRREAGECDAWATIRSGVRKRVGSVCIESRPWRPPDASNAGHEQRRRAQRHLLDDRPLPARAPSRGSLRRQLADAPAHRSGSPFQLSATIVGLAVAPTAPKTIAYASSSTRTESFQMSVEVSAMVRPSGLSVRVCIGLAEASTVGVE